MTKLVLEVTSAELLDLLRLPDVARLLDAGRASVQPDNPLVSVESSTRQRGRTPGDATRTSRQDFFSAWGERFHRGGRKELQTRPTHLLGESTH